MVRLGQDGCGACVGRTIRPGREGGKFRMSGNVLIWHMKGGLGGVRPGELRSEGLQEKGLMAFRCVGSYGAVRLGHQGFWAGRKYYFHNRLSFAMRDERGQHIHPCCSAPFPPA